MSEQDEGPKDDLGRKNAVVADDEIDQDREAILARRKFLVLGAMSAIVVTGVACEPIERIIGRPFACLEPTPMPCLSMRPIPVSQIPCLTPVQQPEPDAGLAIDPLVDAGSVTVEPGPLACLTLTAPHPCLSPPVPPRDLHERRRSRPQPCLSTTVELPPPPPPPCLTPVQRRDRPEPMACLNMLKLSGEGDGEDEDS